MDSSPQKQKYIVLMPVVIFFHLDWFRCVVLTDGSEPQRSENDSAASGDVAHSTHLPQRLQFLQLFIVVVRILSIILQDELVEKHTNKKQINMKHFKRFLKKYPYWTDVFVWPWL